MLTNIFLSGKYGLIVCTDRTLTMRYKARVQIPQRKLLVVQFKLLTFFFSHSVHKTEKKSWSKFQEYSNFLIRWSVKTKWPNDCSLWQQSFEITIIISNLRYSSLRKQQTFCTSTTGFLTKRRLRNKCRISILMTSH